MNIPMAKICYESHHEATVIGRKQCKLKKKLHNKVIINTINLQYLSDIDKLKKITLT